ncbi:MAG: hypothetical protein OEM79_05435 [Nitrosopumilus sp.]|nr:hypothetical protein [Nitrosopumilus sp.]
MKKIQLFSVVFSLIMFTGVTAGTAIAFAESDDNDHDYDIKAKLDGFCEISPEELAALVEKHGKGEDHLADIEEYCTLDDAGRDAFIEEHKDDFTKAHDYDIKAKLDGFCEMSPEDKETLQEKYPMISDHQEKIDEYCSLDESEKDAFIEEHKDDYMKHDYDKRAMMDKFCELSEEDRTAHLEEYQKSRDHLVTMEEYCSLDESEKDAYIEEHTDDYARDHSYKKMDFNIREKMDGFCEMSPEDKEAMVLEHQKSEEHLAEMEEYCSLDDSGRDAFIEEYQDDIKNKMSDHKDSMKGEISTHGDSMKSTLFDHKNSKSSHLKSHMTIKASTLTDKQKDEIKVVHEELRDFKHSLRDNSMSDSEKQEIRDQFMEKAKEFSMTWLSPRHQVAAGIDSNMVECRENFVLVLKTSNASPICVKETTAEKLIERGIVISSI